MRTTLLTAAFVVSATLGVSAAPALTTKDDSQYFVHKAVSGDTLIALANRYLIDNRGWPGLQKLNRIQNPNQILPGTAIRIPLGLMKTEAQTLSVVAVQGPVESSVGKLSTGIALPEGSRVSTGENGFVTLKLADGSTLVLQSKSAAKVDLARKISNTDIPLTRLALDSGRVDARVTKQRGPQARFEISTPTSNMGVRGTQFRVSTDADGKSSRGEVTEGEVSVASANVATPIALAAGFGTVVEAGQAPIAPVKLLAAPDLSSAATLQERILLRFKFSPVASATGYRAQVAADEAFTLLRSEYKGETPEARFGDLADGKYFLRVRGIDARGIEGTDAVLPFTLKARPEPPFASAPANKDKFAGTAATFKWARATEAATYRFQLARDAAFKTLVMDEKSLKSEELSSNTLTPGDYFWRVKSVRANDDAGPFGDVQSFTLKAMPAAPNPPKEEGGKVSFSWGGEPGQRFDFQLARDEKFTSLVSEVKLDKPGIVIDKPSESGTYHMRFRAIDPDGFVGPYSASQTLEVKPNYWWLLLLLLIPAAL